MEYVFKIIKYFLVYWFCLTVIPDVVNDTNSIADLAIASGGFAMLILTMPTILMFFKLPEKNVSARVIISSILTIVYTFALKPGITGLIYFPKSLELGNTSDPKNLYSINLNEFGIIILVTILAVLFVTILDLHIKKK